MRKAIYRQVDTEIVEKIERVTDYDDNGEVIGYHEETVKTEKPVMGLIYVDMTPEEEAEMLRQQKEAEEMERNRPLTAEERVEILEDAFAELCEVIL